MQASASSTEEERHGSTPTFVVSTEPQAPVEMYQDPHATEMTRHLQREIGPMLAELKEAVAQAPLRTKSENSDNYGHVVLKLVKGLAAVGQPVEAARLLRREVPMVDRAATIPDAALWIVIDACHPLTDFPHGHTLKVRVHVRPQALARFAMEYKTPHPL